MKTIPRPTTPQFLRMLKLIFRPIDYLDEYGQRFGDFFAVGREETPFVYVNHPQAIQEIFTADKSLFESGRGNGVLRFLLGENSLVLLDGETHQRQRKLLMPPFHGDPIKNYQQLIVEITKQLTEEWQSGQVFKVRSLMQETTMRVILQAVFGLQKGQRYDQLRELLTTILDATASPLSSTLLFFSILRQDWGKWSPWGRFLSLKAEVDQLLCQEIQERRQQGKLEGEDILSLLLSTKDEEGKEMTMEELKDELMTLLVAGHETTASALTWALYWIHYLPEVEVKLRKELSSLGAFSDVNQIVKLPYLGAICSETLRIYPVALTTFPRILKIPIELMGHEFKQGSVLTPCIYLVHHREDIYPEAKKFKPERFLERQFSPYEYFPFGGGSRRCIGMALALLEMKLVLATLLSKFHLSLLDNRPLKPTRRGLTVAPPSNFKMMIK